MLKRLCMVTVVLATSAFCAHAVEKGGLIVQLGCDDGAQTAELFRGGWTALGRTR